MVYRRSVTLVTMACAALAVATLGCARQPYRQWIYPVLVVEKYCREQYDGMSSYSEEHDCPVEGGLYASTDKLGFLIEHVWYYTPLKGQNPSTKGKLGHFVIRRRRDGSWPAFEFINYDDCADSRTFLEGLIKELESRGCP